MSSQKRYGLVLTPLKTGPRSGGKQNPPAHVPASFKTCMSAGLELNAWAENVGVKISGSQERTCDQIMKKLGKPGLPNPISRYECQKANVDKVKLWSEKTGTKYSFFKTRTGLCDEIMRKMETFPHQ